MRHVSVPSFHSMHVIASFVVHDSAWRGVSLIAIAKTTLNRKTTKPSAPNSHLSSVLIALDLPAGFVSSWTNNTNSFAYCKTISVPSAIFIISSYSDQSLAVYSAGMNRANRYQTGPGPGAMAGHTQSRPANPGLHRIFIKSLHSSNLHNRDCPSWTPTQKRGPKKPAPKTPHRKNRAVKFITIIFP